MENDGIATAGRHPEHAFYLTADMSMDPMESMEFVLALNTYSQTVISSLQPNSPIRLFRLYIYMPNYKYTCL